MSDDWWWWLALMPCCRCANPLNLCIRADSWIEFWQRKKRQYFCHTQTWTESTFGLTSWTPHFAKPQCLHIDDDLRQATCTNKQSQQLLEVLKSELECGWDSGAHGTANVALVLAVTVATVMLGVWRH